MKWWRRPGTLAAVGRMRLATATLGRHPRLWWNIVRGYYNRLQAQGWWLLLSTLAFVGVPLIVLGQLDRSGKIGLGGTLSWWTSTLGVVVAIFLVLTLRWLVQTRKRVIVESFVDFTKEDAKAVSGLSTLLVTELGRLRELYQQIDDLSVPTAVGVESHGGYGRGKEAGVFLTVSADDATSVLEDAVASDAGISVGAAKISLKPILTFLNRVTRGPRVVGSVHLTEAGGGPTLTAQLISKGQCVTWRIDQPREPESPEQRKAFLDSMVRELACRMFTQLTLHGSVRPKAVEAFNEYMQLYDEARRTPRDRAHLLKRAQGELLKAVAEDERFDLAYYNLGVIYMQLAHTERIAEEESDDLTSRANFDRSELDAARGEAARVAFQRAVGKNPERWEAYYALAVTTFSEVSEIKIEEPLDIDAETSVEKQWEVEKRCEQLRKVIAFCGQAVRVAPNRHANLAAIYDLRGMARARLGKDFGAAFLDHRRSIHHSWIEYCQVRRRNAARPDGLPDLVAHASANGAAALHNLALARERQVLLCGSISDPSIRDRLHLATAHRHFRRATRLAGHGSAVTAATRFERGAVYDRAGKHEKAAKQLRLAASIHPKSPEYHALLAQALAGRPQKAGEATTFARLALKLLAQPFSLAVLPFGTRAVALRCRATLTALEMTYARLGDDAETRRIHEIAELQETLKDTISDEDPKTGRRSKPKSPSRRAGRLKGRLDDLRAIRKRRRASRPPGNIAISPHTWQLDQIELAMGRLYADARSWQRADEIFKDLVDRLKRERRTKAIVEFGAYAHRARALREHRPKDKEALVAALDIAAEGIRRAPLDIESRREAGRAHYALKQFSDALDAWKHALWLSPTDPYLHYETAMCHRGLARDQTDEEVRQLELDCAKLHFEKAQELFDGEDLDGEAWTRFWRGKIALEADDPMEALEYLKGAEHGSAEAAAALLLGEAHLRLDQRPAADHAFTRCEKALKNERSASRLPGRRTIDALWGDELPEIGVRARIARGKAEAQYLAPGDWQSSTMGARAKRRLARAAKDAEGLNRKQPDEAGARDEVEMRILETTCRLSQARGEIDEALEYIRERLRYKKTEEAQRLEAELLELRAQNGATIDDKAARTLAAKHMKRSLPRNGFHRSPAPVAGNSHSQR